jgi:adenosylcobinamide kinase / adenosylcobinamide-phosphate guanylyltransferase
MAAVNTLLLGGARSGKSRLAARWAAERSRAIACIVTARAGDAEMSARIEAHRRDRPASWLVREAFEDLAGALREIDASGRTILIDCLTLWTSNCLWPDGGEVEARPPDRDGWHARREAFLEALAECRADIIIVSNEVGQGIVPSAPAARIFRDEHGTLNQQVAGLCDEVYLVVAGLSVPLKRPG